jgi:hypothetical protein
MRITFRGEGWADDAPVALTLWQSEPCGAQPAAVDEMEAHGPASRRWRWTERRRQKQKTTHARFLEHGAQSRAGRLRAWWLVPMGAAEDTDGADGATKSEKRREKERGRARCGKEQERQWQEGVGPDDDEMGEARPGRDWSRRDGSRAVRNTVQEWDMRECWARLAAEEGQTDGGCDGRKKSSCTQDATKTKAPT